VPPHLSRLAIIAGILVAWVMLATAGAALALPRPKVAQLDTDNRSRLRADYSVDPRGLRMAPLNAAIVEAAIEDEEALTAPVTTSTRG
jgi:hypothetical protein